MTLHLFNPENDLALAADLDRYTPPAAAVALRRCGALLPAWLAERGDAVMVYSEQDAEAASELRSRYGIEVDAVISVPDSTEEYAPWGWSRHARRCFIDAGADPADMPSDAWLERHRHLSSRFTTVDLCRYLGLEPPVIALTVGQAVDAVAANFDKGAKGSFMKMPWSSSGRGVFPTDGMKPDLIQRRSADIIRSQGAVIIEPDRGKKADFAALYRIEDGKVHFHALSAFATDLRGAYRGNLVISDSEIISRLGVDPMAWVDKMSEAMTAVVASDYSGWAGVDMVTTETGGIYPCIELNLRATMGVVAAAMRPYFNGPMLLAPSPANPRSHIPVSL